MNILAIDTATEACSAAFLREDGNVFAEFEVAPRQHTRLLPKMMDSILAAANCPRHAIDYCAVSNGPGAFTGIRIGVSTAQGIAIGLGIPLVPISTLATLAQCSLDRQGGDSTLVALDARMNEVYWGLYRRQQGGLAELVGDEHLSRVEDVVSQQIPDSGAGHGWLVNEGSWVMNKPTIVDSELLPDARSLLKLAEQAVCLNQAVDVELVGINYLRNRVAEKAKK